MLNFNCSIQEVIANQTSTKKTSQFVEYTSKKKILEVEGLTEDQKFFIREIKGTFSFTLHNSNKYLIITFYAQATKKYDFLIVDLDTMNCAKVDSIKNAKLEVLKLLNPDETTAEAEVVKNTEEAEAAQKPTKKKSTNK